MNQKGTIALVPTNDEMTLVGGNMSITKTNVYRSLVDQPLLAANTSATSVAASYCQNLVNIQSARNQLDMAADTAFGSPVAAVGNNLATFLGNRLAMSFTNLNCGDFGLTNVATPTLDGNGVATAVTYSLTQQAATGATAPRHRRGERRRWPDHRHSGTRRAAAPLPEPVRHVTTAHREALKRPRESGAASAVSGAADESGGIRSIFAICPITVG